MVNYRNSGVDFNSVGKFRESIVRELKFEGKKHRRSINIGQYAGLVSFANGFMALHTDGVGTKTLLASKYDYFDEIGYDLVGMNVNDIVCIGAEPVAMVEYIAGSKFDPVMGEKIGRSVNRACEEAGISMIGGETASVPDLVKEIDISGTVVGFLKKGKEITGKKIREGDKIIGLPSSGMHSNGFSLIRNIYKGKEGLLEENLEGEPLWRTLMRGTKIYSREVSELKDNYSIHGLAHITGGGIRNILRLKDMKYTLELPDPPPVFKRVMKQGKLSLRESYQVFNMGIGFVLVVPKREVDSIVQDLHKLSPVEIGNVSSGAGVVIRNLKISFKNYY